MGLTIDDLFSEGSITGVTLNTQSATVGSFSATTISGATYYGNGANLTGISPTITTYSLITTGTLTTVSTTATLMAGTTLSNVVVGNYLLNFGTTFSSNSNNGIITTSIYIGGNEVTGSPLTWSRGAGQGNIQTVHGYSGFPIVVSTTSNVEIYWLTGAGTATANNRYISLIKV